MRIYISKEHLMSHGCKGPYIDIERSSHGVNVLISDSEGYYIARREEISNAELLEAINDIINRPRSARKF